MAGFLLYGFREISYRSAHSDSYPTSPRQLNLSLEPRWYCKKYSGIRHTSLSGVLNRRLNLSNLSEQPWAQYCCGSARSRRTSLISSLKVPPPLPDGVVGYAHSSPRAGVGAPPRHLKQTPGSKYQPSSTIAIIPSK